MPRLSEHVLARRAWTRRLRGGILLLAVATVFLIANRGAYEGYFQDDELDNLSLTQQMGWQDFLKPLVSPRLASYNFRPVGHAFFGAAGGLAGLHFPSHVAAIHLLHLLNVWLVWLMACRIGAGAWAASAGALLFAFHAAAFDVYWKPMYVFDALCATFCLLSALSYAHGRWIVSLGMFWLAYKAKELAVALPAVLALYELWFAGRRWKRLLPFLAVSLSFGLQAVFSTANAGTDYGMKLTAGGLWRTASFYAGRLLLAPEGAMAAAALFTLCAAVAVAGRDRRVWFGLAAMGLLLSPMLLFPGRRFSAYLYAPLAFGALAIAGILSSKIVASRARLAPALTVVFFAGWLPFNYAHLRHYRKAVIAAGDENRAYVAGLAETMPQWAGARVVVLDSGPAGMAIWGREGALKYLSRRRDLRIVPFERRDRDALTSGDVAVLSWDEEARRVYVAKPAAGAPSASYIRMTGPNSSAQLLSGWYATEGRYRWTMPDACAELQRPAGAQLFEMEVRAGAPGMELRVLVDGRPIGTERFAAAGWRRLRWPVGSSGPGAARVEFHAAPAFHAPGDPRALGVAVAAFGFAENGRFGATAPRAPRAPSSPEPSDQRASE